MVHPARFELATPWFEAKYSNPLSYGCTHQILYHITAIKISAIIILMEMITGVALKPYTTMRLGGEAKLLTTATSLDDVKEAYRYSKQRNLPVFVLGGGSNVIARDEGYKGIVLLNRLKGVEILEDDGVIVTLKIAAGEIWDEVVARSVEMGLQGIEAMSAIPGTAGAAPVQNVGAYGQEIADTLVNLEAYDSVTGEVVTLAAADCQFSYRHSIFRGQAAGRYCIISVTLRLYRRAPQPPFYGAIQRYFDEKVIPEPYDVAMIRDAVIEIRRDKLPDPKQEPNTGSFFKNALISSEQFQQLQKAFPDAPHYDMSDGMVKVPTGWLIEQSGLKGRILHGMRVHDKNALVLVNESATGYGDLAAAREEIIQTVYRKFHIQIQQEPLELG